jgi:hypothetical protein
MHRALQILVLVLVLVLVPEGRAQTFSTGDYQINRKKSTAGFEVAELLAGSNINITWNDATKTATLATGTGSTSITTLGTITIGTWNATPLATAFIADEAVTFAKMQHISTAHLLGRHSSGSGAVQQIGIDGGLELQGANLRRAALTGDVTASAGSNSTTIANDAVTYAKLQNVSAASKLLGRGSVNSGDAQEITLGAGLSMSGTTLNSSDDLTKAVYDSLNTGFISGLPGIDIDDGVGGAGGELRFYGGSSYAGATAGQVGGTGGSIYLYGGEAHDPSGNGGSIISTGSDQGFSGGTLNMSGGSDAAGGSITTSNGGGSITTSNGGGSINTTGQGSIELGAAGGNRTTLTGNATTDRAIAFPDASGTLLLDGNTLTTGLTFPPSGLLLQNEDDTTYKLNIQAQDATQTATRILYINTQNADRSIDLSGDLTVSSAATISGTNTGDQTTITGNSGTTTAALGLKTATSTVALSTATAPSSGQVLTATSGTAANWQTPAATGIGGTVGTTNNALPRASGTGGSTLQGSAVTIADDGTLTKAEAYELGQTGTNYGRIQLWDADALDWVSFSAGPSKFIFPDIQAISFTGSGSSITSLDANNISSGTLGVARGGTGLTSAGTAGNVLTSDGTIWTSTALYATDLQARQGISTTTAIAPATLWNALHDSLFIADFSRFISTTVTGSGSIITTGGTPYPATGATANSTARGYWITQAKSGSSTWATMDFSRPSAFGLTLCVGSGVAISTGIFRVWFGTDTNASSIAARGYGFEIRQHRIWIIAHNGTTLVTQDTGADISSTSFVLNVMRCVNDGAGNISVFLNNAQIGTALAGGPTTAGTATFNILNLNGATAASNDIRTLAGTFTANVY